MNKTKISFLFLSMFACIGCQASSSLGTYSNLSLHQETGDLLGVEISIIPTKKGMRCIFIESQGEPSVPVIGECGIDDKMNFYLNLPDNNVSYSGRFKGNIDSQKLLLNFSNGQLSPRGEKKVILKKSNGYWDN